MSSSYIILPDPAPHPLWPHLPLLDPPSMFVFAPPPPDRATVYAASLAGDDLLEELRAALIEGDDLGARMALHVLRGLAEVALAKLGTVH
jgi:hypothetical protein